MLRTDLKETSLFLLQKEKEKQRYVQYDLAVNMIRNG